MTFLLGFSPTSTTEDRKAKIDVGVRLYSPPRNAGSLRVSREQLVEVAVLLAFDLPLPVDAILEPRDRGELGEIGQLLRVAQVQVRSKRPACPTLRFLS